LRTIENRPLTALCTARLKLVGDIGSPRAMPCSNSRDKGVSPWRDAKMLGISSIPSTSGMAAAIAYFPGVPKRRRNRGGIPVRLILPGGVSIATGLCNHCTQSSLVSSPGAKAAQDSMRKLDTKDILRFDYTRL
jgi:hypothetical protein